MKRYFQGVRKPFLLQGLWRCMLAVLFTVIFMLIVREFLVTQVRESSSRPDLGLMSGDRILVNRWSYGLRLPMMHKLGYRRIGACSLEKGDLVVFDYPDGMGKISLERVTAVPGDTIWLDGDDCKTTFTIVPEHSCGLGRIVLPEQYVIGRPVCISYSIDDGRPLFKKMRWNRVFLQIGAGH